MMRNCFSLTFFIVLIFSFSAMADNASDSIQSIDGLFYRGMELNYDLEGMTLIKKSYDLATKALETDPDNYDLLWRCARAASEYGETARGIEIEGWKDICRQWGKKGIDLTTKAQGINPDRVEAYYWQSHSVGIYSYASSLMDALNEGLYGKSVRSMEKAYEIDKSYLDYSPVYFFIMFYHRLPWPFKNRDKALKYYDEFSAMTKWSWESHVRYTYVAEFLLSLKDEKYTQEGIKLIEAVLSSPHPRKFYQDWASDIKQKTDL